MITNIFRTKIKTLNAGLEPEFDYSVNFNCMVDGNSFIVAVYGASPDKITELKQKYEWIEEKEVPDPIDPLAGLEQSS